MVNAHPLQLTLSVSAAMKKQTTAAALGHVMVQASTGVVQLTSSRHHCSAPLGPESSEEPSTCCALPTTAISAELPQAGGCRLEGRRIGRLSEVWPDVVS